MRKAQKYKTEKQNEQQQARHEKVKRAATDCQDGVRSATVILTAEAK